MASKFEPEPDPYAGEENCNQASVNLERMFHYQKAKLDQFEDDDQYAAAEAVQQSVDKSLSLQSLRILPSFVQNVCCALINEAVRFVVSVKSVIVSA